METTKTPNAQQAEAAKAENSARNKKIIIWSCICVAVVGIALTIIFTVRHYGNAKANDAIGLADIELNDSVRTAMYKQIADDGSYKANERAQLMTAITYYNDSNYQECLNYLDKPSVSSDIISTGIQSLKGDCYVNLNKLPEAVECYKKAIDCADENTVLTPFVLNKLAQVYAEQKNYAEELACYEQIRRDYPNAIPDIEKYYLRAKARAGK